LTVHTTLYRSNDFDYDGFELKNIFKKICCAVCVIQLLDEDFQDFVQFDTHGFFKLIAEVICKQMYVHPRTTLYYVKSELVIKRLRNGFLK